MWREFVTSLLLPRTTCVFDVAGDGDDDGGDGNGGEYNDENQPVVGGRL